MLVHRCWCTGAGAGAPRSPCIVEGGSGSCRPWRSSTPPSVCLSSVTRKEDESTNVHHNPNSHNEADPIAFGDDANALPVFNKISPGLRAHGAALQKKGEKEEEKKKM